MALSSFRDRRCRCLGNACCAMESPKACSTRCRQRWQKLFPDDSVGQRQWCGSCYVQRVCWEACFCTVSSRWGFDFNFYSTPALHMNWNWIHVAGCKSDFTRRMRLSAGAFDGRPLWSGAVQVLPAPGADQQTGQFDCSLGYLQGQQSRFWWQQRLLSATALHACDVATWWDKSCVQASGEEIKPAAPLWTYAAVAASNVAATTCQYEALKHVTLPVQTIGKSGKLLPVMLWGTLLLGKRYRARAYAEAVGVAAGCWLFLSTGDVSIFTHWDRLKKLIPWKSSSGCACIAMLCILCTQSKLISISWEDRQVHWHMCAAITCLLLRTQVAGLSITCHTYCLYGLQTLLSAGQDSWRRLLQSLPLTGAKLLYMERCSWLHI